jgi:hypothetical protein
MRCESYGLGALFLIAGHALAAEPVAVNPPPKSAASAAPKAPAPPKAGDAPPPEYYVEPSAPPDGAVPSAPPAAAPAPGAPSAPPRSAAPDSGPPGPPPPPPTDSSAGQIYEPQPPGFYPSGAPLYDPPPPPEPHHVAPRTSLWLAARAGVFIPFGSAWSRGTTDAQGNVNFKGVPWSDYVSSGPMFELDAGARLSRNYNVFAIWERAQLGSGSGDVTGGVGKSNGGDTDFWGVGIRATSDPDRVGFVTELAVGWRRARATYDDGSEVQFTEAPFEARLGLGAEFRLNQYVSLSPMATLGVGSFGKIERKTGSTIKDQQDQDDQADGHAWATLTFGGNFDLLGSKR